MTLNLALSHPTNTPQPDRARLNHVVTQLLASYNSPAAMQVSLIILASCDYLGSYHSNYYQARVLIHFNNLEEENIG